MNRARANRHTRWNAPLGRWLVLSVALHMTILIVWHSSPLLKGQRETVLSVMLAPSMSVPPPAKLTRTGALLLTVEIAMVSPKFPIKAQCFFRDFFPGVFLPEFFRRPCHLPEAAWPECER